MSFWRRIERLESASSARTARAASGAKPTLAVDYERLFKLLDHVREHGLDAPVPEHLLADRDRESEREVIDWLRTSGSGWDADREAIGFLAAWEKDLA